MICIFSVRWASFTYSRPCDLECPDEFFLKNNLAFGEFNRCKCRKISRFPLLGRNRTRSSEKKYATLICNSNGQPWDLDGLDTKQHLDSEFSDTSDYDEESESRVNNEEEWSPDQLDAIASLFRGRTPPKSKNQMNKERYLPLPMPHKIRPLGLPQSKRVLRSSNPSGLSMSKRLYKNPDFLIKLAREIRDLSPDKEASSVLDKWVGVLKKGSLSLTIRELGHMGLPQRALQTFCWAQKYPQFYPDDRILGSTLEILARAGELKTPFGLQHSLSSGNKDSLEAIARGFIKSGQCKQAREVLLAARDSSCELDDGIYAKLFAQASKSRSGHKLAVQLLEELGMRDKLNLEIQDCTVVMKGCIRLEMYEVVESLFRWWKESGQKPNVVMYTTVMHSRYCSENFREALALVWEMEESNCLLDLPAYRVIIRLCAKVGDLSRAARYFSKLKNAGFSPTYDIYSHLLTLYTASGRSRKSREVLKEMERVGFKPNLDALQDATANLSENESTLTAMPTADCSVEEN